MTLSLFDSEIAKVVRYTMRIMSKFCRSWDRWNPKISLDFMIFWLCYYQSLTAHLEPDFLILPMQNIQNIFQIKSRIGIFI